ncbi:MAG: hypothetical protein WBA84_05205 [Carnobacterium sp.]|uniref:hypothetical protein n=1 Tax=Carnobacterium sp. TaxID=48221 RepID=UPI003C774002
MTKEIKDGLVMVVSVLVALFLNFFTQSLFPQLDFLTLSDNLVDWGYFLIVYVFYFYIVSKFISYIRRTGGS